jgi:opacity protein-like surface antigen
MRIAAFLPKARRETRGRAWILRPAQKNKFKGGFMKWKLLVSLLAVLSFFGTTAYAQDTPKVDIFAGYSYVRDNPSTSGVNSFSLNGGSASFAYNATSWLSGVADIGAYHNGNILGTGTDGTLSTYLFGPRISYRHSSRITPFGEVLFGVAHAGASIAGTSGSDNAFAMSLGGGVDYKLTDRFAIRPIKVDYLMTRFSETGTGNQTQNNLRVSTGIVFRF